MMKRFLNLSFKLKMGIVVGLLIILMIGLLQIPYVAKSANKLRANIVGIDRSVKLFSMTGEVVSNYTVKDSTIELRPTGVIYIYSNKTGLGSYIPTHQLFIIKDIK